MAAHEEQLERIDGRLWALYPATFLEVVATAEGQGNEPPDFLNWYAQHGRKAQMTEIKTHRELYGTDPKPGYEWDAGNTPPHVRPGGRRTVRLTWAGWDVIFHPFPIEPQKNRPDEVLGTFGPGEEAERQAKAYARSLVEEVWGR